MERLIKTGEGGLPMDLAGILKTDERGLTKRQNQLLGFLDNNSDVFNEHEAFVRYLDKLDLLRKYYDFDPEKKKEQKELKKFYKRIKEQYGMRWPFYEKKKKSKKSKK